ncbi:TPA: hypothetical protein QDC59_001412 [Burkholderia cenocepacia]|nr:hypothetical protein [Burkholderia cenocepacia]
MTLEIMVRSRWDEQREGNPGGYFGHRIFAPDAREPVALSGGRRVSMPHFREASSNLMTSGSDFSSSQILSFCNNP